jgi:hypothetical protein
MVQIVPMSTALSQELFEFIETEEPEILARQRLLARIMVMKDPELRDELLDEGLAPLLHLFGRKLGRPLDRGEHQLLHERLSRLGPDRLGDVVIDLDAAALSAWLADPAAQ